MINIKKIKVTKPFAYLWLKSVRGVNLDEHCAKSIVGEYDGRINAHLTEATDVVLPELMYYLCGVAKPYRWENNFHLAFRYKKGSAIAYESNGVMVTITDAEIIPFSQADIDIHLPQASKKAFSTCRNWQFANWHKKHIT